MPILNNRANAFLGATQVEKIYRGAELIWQLLRFPPWEDNNVAGSVFLDALQDYVVGKTFTQTTATFGSFAGVGKWHGGVLAPNGKI
jgi:hypothetical protein